MREAKNEVFVMGFFSWKTADSKESIASIYSGYHQDSIYLLQPGGKAPIKEDAYEGLGMFGEIDAYEWLARHNLNDRSMQVFEKEPFPKQATEDLRDCGIAIGIGVAYLDKETGTKYIFKNNSNVHTALALSGYIDEERDYIFDRFDMPLPSLGYDSIKDCISSRRVVSTPLVNPEQISNPLKFSASPYAVYEALPASEECPEHGFFFSEPVKMTKPPKVIFKSHNNTWVKTDLTAAGGSGHEHAEVHFWHMEGGKLAVPYYPITRHGYDSKDSRAFFVEDGNSGTFKIVGYDGLVRHIREVEQRADRRINMSTKNKATTKGPAPGF